MEGVKAGKINGGFVEEMRSIAMEFHVGEFMDGKWEPTVEGYLQFLVDSQMVFATLERIVFEAKHPAYVELRNTGLEREQKIEKDAIWFQEQGYPIPKPSPSGIAYSSYLEGIALDDPAAFVCHFYNIYFAHTAGGRIIGKKVSKKLLKNHELNFYKWDGELSQLMQNARERLNQIAQGMAAMPSSKIRFCIVRNIQSPTSSSSHPVVDLKESHTKNDVKWKNELVQRRKKTLFGRDQDIIPLLISDVKFNMALSVTQYGGRNFLSKGIRVHSNLNLNLSENLKPSNT